MDLVITLAILFVITSIAVSIIILSKLLFTYSSKKMKEKGIFKKLQSRALKKYLGDKKDD